MRVNTAAYGVEAIVKLAELVAEAKRGDALAPVTIVVRDNIAAITVRRALARGVGARKGVAAINVTTLRRLAEQVLARAGDTQPPVTPARLTTIWRRALAAAPGCFAPVATHSATVRSLVRVHSELRVLDTRAVDAIAKAGVLSSDVVSLHREVTSAALDGRRDEVAVLQDAAQHVRDSGLPDGLGAVILHLPEEHSPAESDLIDALDSASILAAVVGVTGHVDVDRPLMDAFGGDDARDRSQRHADTEPRATRIVHASDSDDEVLAIVREVRALLADGKPAHRIAVLHPVAVPYARLLHDHFSTAGITTNGPGVRALRDRAIADAFLTLLVLDPDDLQRVALLDLLGRAPMLLGDENFIVPRTRWERLSREAGITGGDWAGRLADHEARHQARLDADRDNPDSSTRSLAYRERSIGETQELAGFVAELQHRLREGRALTGWAALGEWATGILHRYLGNTDAIRRLPEDEQRAATAIENTLGALAELDGVGDSPSIAALVAILDADLDTRRPRVGRFGDGVFVGPIGSAPSLDVDHVFVLGLSEDLYPGRQGIDPLLPDSVRVRTEGGLLTSTDRRRQQHRAVLAAFAAGSNVTASFPRGDLRRGAERLPSRWLMPTLRFLAGSPELEATRWAEASSPAIHSVASHWAGITSADRPGNSQEWRLRQLAADDVLVDDPALDAALDLIRARRDDAFTRFDGNLEGVAGLPDYADGQTGVSPTALECYAGCPHAFFIERVLGVKPLETPEEIITLRPWDLGSIIHEVMDQLTTESDPLPDFGKPWSGEHREQMRRLADEVMADFERRGLTGHPRLWARERDQIARDLEILLDLDDQAHAANDSRIVASELPFGMRGKPPVRVDLESGVVAMRGSADRVDETRGGRLIVTDFKTGSARGFGDIDADPVVAGRKLQLPLYAHAARDAFGIDDVGAGYWFVGRRDRGKRVDVTLDAQLEDIYRVAIETLVVGIREGRFIARPPAKDDFLWVQCAFCNPDGVGYAHVRGPAERKRTDAVLANLFGLLDPSVLIPQEGNE